MASEVSEGLSTATDTLLEEFETWQASFANDKIFLLENNCDSPASIVLTMVLGGEHEFKLYCPSDYPSHDRHFFVKADAAVKPWCIALNQFVVECPKKLMLADFLNRAVDLFSPDLVRKLSSSSAEEEYSDEDEDDVSDEDDECIILDDDEAFTTEWDLKVTVTKKRWAKKEEIMREEMKKARLSLGTGNSQVRPQTNQIFTKHAASGILTNDLIHIMQCDQKNLGFHAEPKDDNIYMWNVKLLDFEEGSDLDKDLDAVKELFGYKYIELEISFELDLYPFYPPRVHVLRPRLQGSMMQRVTNMEVLKLSYWSPAKDMKSVIPDIKDFLQQWARLEVTSERNDRTKYPDGSYLLIEHHLLTLALLSEINPRAIHKYQLDESKASELMALSPMKRGNNSNHEFWAAGVGFGNSKQPEWDINAYLAAREEKDRQIESTLQQIASELRMLYAKHAPQLQPRRKPPDVAADCQTVNPIENMFVVLEGSALIPFIEQYMRAESFLEISRHAKVYKMILDIMKEISMQHQLVPLLCALPNQSKSIYSLLQNVQKKASIVLQHICKAGNGCIPTGYITPGHTGGAVSSTSGPIHYAQAESPSHGNVPSDEKLAKELTSLYNEVKETLTRRDLLDCAISRSEDDVEDMEIAISTSEGADLEIQYKHHLRDLQFDSCDIELKGSHCHHYATEFKGIKIQGQVLRIAQELSSLSSSLPLNLSSSIFVRTDDEKLTLMRALIIGPEGTPYSNGCFLFDIFFPSIYPAGPPLVNLQTTGGGAVRFNPNLYNCGKVCLSLLGTWAGQRGEQWNDTTSTVLQVLVSIQSLILVSDPYFNEPGYEEEIGTESGSKNSQHYNNDVRLNCIKYAMNAAMQNPCPAFADVIKTHFYLKKEKIIKEAEDWLKSAGRSKRLQQEVQNLRRELSSLSAPTHLNNDSNTTDSQV